MRFPSKLNTGNQMLFTVALALLVATISPWQTGCSDENGAVPDQGVPGDGGSDAAPLDAEALDALVQDAGGLDGTAADAPALDAYTGGEASSTQDSGALIFDSQASDVMTDSDVLDAYVWPDVGPVDAWVPGIEAAPADAVVWPESGPGDAFVWPDATNPPAWITIPAGTFTMGSPTNEICRHSDETQHQVTLTHDFEISSYEVVQGEFQALMGYNPSCFGPNGIGWDCGSNCPVEMLNWHEAVAYCNALSAQKGLAECYSCSGSGAPVTCQEATAYSGGNVYDCPGYRLPTEAEWEYAYRAGSTTAFYLSAGNNGTITVCKDDNDPNADKIAWYDHNTGGTRPVGLKAPNAWGLYDMAGNANEWCHDRYRSDYENLVSTDPWGATTGSERARRGGSAFSEPYGLRAARRFVFWPADERQCGYGFRCARTINP